LVDTTVKVDVNYDVFMYHRVDLIQLLIIGVFAFDVTWINESIGD